MRMPRWCLLAPTNLPRERCACVRNVLSCAGLQSSPPGQLCQPRGGCEVCCSGLPARWPGPRTARGAAMPGAAVLQRRSPVLPAVSGRFSAMSVDCASYACRAPSGLRAGDSDSDSGAEASFSIIAPRACARRPPGSQPALCIAPASPARRRADSDGEADSSEDEAQSAAPRGVRTPTPPQRAAAELACAARHGLHVRPARAAGRPAPRPPARTRGRGAGGAAPQVATQRAVSRFDAALLEVDAQEAEQLARVEAWMQGKKVRTRRPQVAAARPPWQRPPSTRTLLDTAPVRSARAGVPLWQQAAVREQGTCSRPAVSWRARSGRSVPPPAGEGSAAGRAGARSIQRARARGLAQAARPGPRLSAAGGRARRAATRSAPRRGRRPSPATGRRSASAWSACTARRRRRWARRRTRRPRARPTRAPPTRARPRRPRRARPTSAAARSCSARRAPMPRRLPPRMQRVAGGRWRGMACGRQCGRV